MSKIHQGVTEAAEVVFLPILLRRTVRPLDPGVIVFQTTNTLDVREMKVQKKALVVRALLSFRSQTKYGDSFLVRSGQLGKQFILTPVIWEKMAGVKL